MNFDDAIAAHIKWKIQLSQYIDGVGSERLSSTTVCKDDSCELGKWIYGEGSKFRELPSFQRLVIAHENFHAKAASIVKTIEDGDKTGAKASMTGPFAIASKETVTAIMNLKREAAEKSVTANGRLAPNRLAA